MKKSQESGYIWGLAGIQTCKPFLFLRSFLGDIKGCPKNILDWTMILKLPVNLAKATSSIEWKPFSNYELPVIFKANNII